MGFNLTTNGTGTPASFEADKRITSNETFAINQGKKYSSNLDCKWLKIATANNMTLGEKQRMGNQVPMAR